MCNDKQYYSNCSIEFQWFVIESKSRNGLVLDVERGRRGGRIILLPRRNDRESQLWAWKQHILLNYKGYILDMQGGLKAAGTYATAFDDYNGVNQKWKVDEDKIVSLLNDLALTSTVSENDNYHTIQLWPRTDQAINEQLWQFVSIDTVESRQSVSFECEYLNSYSASNNLLSTNTYSRVTTNYHPTWRIVRNKNISIEKTLSLEKQEQDETNKILDCLPYNYSNYKIHTNDIDLFDWYFDDELQPSLRNDPNMQLISSYSDQFDTKNTSHFSCLLSETGIAIIYMIVFYCHCKYINTFLNVLSNIIVLFFSRFNFEHGIL